METESSREAVLVSLRQLRLMGWDWDGVGGLPLRGDVGDTVTDIYEQFSFTDYMPMPVVSMNGDGTIDVEYDSIDDGRKLFLTFKCQGIVTYIKVYPDDATTVEGTIRLDMLGDALDDFAELQETFEWLSSE